MLIVDALVHIRGGGKPTNPNHRQVERFSKDDLLKEMDEAGVDAAVMHPRASWDPNSNELAVEAARQHPDRFAILGNFPLDRPESRSLIEGWKRRLRLIIDHLGRPSGTKDAAAHGHLAPDQRRLRPRADVLGDRHHPHAVRVAAVRDALHGRAALAVGKGQGAHHGTRPLRVARLEAQVRRSRWR